MRKTWDAVKTIVKGEGVTPKLAFIGGLLIGVLFFISMYGIAVVNPGNIEWIFSGGGDLAQHYLGWAFYRQSDWSLPLGMAADLAYPFSIPVTYMDAIPLFAILFKVLSPILPETFQYLGLFTLLSYMLQGGFAALILQRFTKNIYVIAICSVFFVLSPVLIMRSFVHTALTATWLILTGIYLIIRFNRARPSMLFTIVVWSALMIMGVLIHPYFLPMLLALFAIFLIRTYKKEPIYKTIIKSAAPLILALSCFGLMGGFSPAGDNLGSIDLDIYSSNLVSLFDPLGYSSITSHEIYRDDRPDSFETSEKLAYLGLGLILFIPIIFYEFTRKYTKKTSSLKSDIKILLKRKNLLTAIIVFVVFIFSLGSHIKFGNVVLFEWPLPSFIEKIWLIFRSSARMFWPIYYAIVIGIFGWVICKFKGYKPWVLVAFLLPFLLVQMIDVRLSGQVRDKKRFIHEISAATSAESPITNKIIKNYCDRDHLISLSPYLYLEEFTMFAQPSLACDMTMSVGYYSHHYKSEDIEAFTNSEKEKIISGDADFSDNLYMTTDVEFVDAIDEIYQVEKINNWYIISEK